MPEPACYIASDNPPAAVQDRVDRRWSVWASILFMLAVSLALWALIALGVLQMIALD